VANAYLIFNISLACDASFFSGLALTKAVFKRLFMGTIDQRNENGKLIISSLSDPVLEKALLCYCVKK